MRVLIVQQSDIQARISRNLLAVNGISSVAADGGEDALRIVQGGSIDLVLAEMAMAPMTGLQLLQAIRAEPVNSKVPFILVLADDGHSSSAVAAAKEAGANNYILRPFDAQTLKRKIDAVMMRALASSGD